MNDGEDPEQWQARHDRHASKAENPTRSGMPVSVAVAQLPTVSTSNANGNQTNNRGELLLPGVVESLPTPTGALGDGGQTSRGGDRQGEQLLPGVVESLPTPALLRTPTATEGKRGSISAEYAASPRAYDTVSRQSEDLPRPALLPTTTAQDSASSRNSTAKRKGGTDGVHLGDTLTDATSRLPLDEREAGLDLIPTPTTRDWKDGAENPNVPTNSLLGRTVWEFGIPDGAPENSVEAYEQLWDSLTDQSPYWITDKADYWPAISRWAAIMGRPAPAPTIPDGKDGRFRLSARFAEWMMGMPAGWVTAVELGLTRNEQLKACGNGVVWQQAALAMDVLMPILWGIAA